MIFEIGKQLTAEFIESNSLIFGEILIEDLEFIFKDTEVIDPIVLGQISLLAKKSKRKIKYDISKLEYSYQWRIANYLEFLAISWTDTVIVVSNISIKYASSKIFPIIPVDKDNLNLLFRIPYSQTIKPLVESLSKEKSWDKYARSKNDNNDELEKYIKGLINDRFSTGSKNEKYISTLLSFYLNLLSSLKGIKPFAVELTSKLNPSMQINYEMGSQRLGKFGKTASKEYWEWLYDFVESEILTKPPFYMVIFNLMVSNNEELFENLLSTKTEIIKLSELAKEYYHRSMELVNNIIEHSSTKEGVIACRIFNKNQLKDTFPSRVDYLRIKSIESVDKYFVLEILDLGDDSIIDTCITQWNKSTDETLVKDSKRLMESRDLSELFFVGENPYHHQTIRSIGCIGLSIFAEMTKRRGGYFEVDSKSKRNINLIETTKIRWQGEEIQKIKSNSPLAGTQYSVMLPISQQIVTTFQEFISVPSTSSIEILIKKKSENEIIKDNYNISLTGIDFLCINAFKDNIEELRARENKHDIEKVEAENIAYQYLKKISITENIIVCLDCSNINGDTFGSLFRLLGILQATTSIESLVIFELEDNLIEQLKISLIDKSGKKYWGENKFLVLYDKIGNPTIIGGQDYSELKQLNWLLAYSHKRDIGFNMQNDITKNPDYQLLKTIVGNNPLFTNTENTICPSLIPLHYLFKDSSGRTIVEKRVARIMGSLINEGIIG